MKDTVFINDALDKAIKSYIATKNNEDELTFNSFLVAVIRILVLIYGEEDIINPYYLQNSVVFINNLSKYGYGNTNITIFLADLLNFEKLEKENRKKKIKEKNPYFINVQKYLVDMFVAKKNKVNVSYKEEEEFLDLLYTKNTSNYYRLSYNYLTSDDPNYIEKYYYSRLNGLDATRVDLNKTISGNINLDALKYMGINLSNLNGMSEEEMQNAQNQIYNYFEIDEASLNKEQELKDAINNYQMPRKVTTGNGYVDVLLLMSVIVTSLSVLAIIIIRII